MTKIIYDGREYNFSLAKVHLDKGGYDKIGTYYGRGAPLYRAYERGNAIEFRALSREDAIEVLKIMVRQGKFD